MTAQRLVRGSKARIIATFAAMVFGTGLLVLFHNDQTQLRNVKKNYDICLQQQESLSTQLQVIVDYKTRLEKSLQSEKAEHKQTRTELEARINDEKTRRDKTSVEANLRFTSLQQHYKLLQRKHDDVKEKSDKLQQQYLEETDKLQAKVKELQEQLKQSEKNKEKSLEHLKSLYLQLDNDKTRLTEQLKKSESDHAKWESDLNHWAKKNHQLQRKIDSLQTQRNLKVQSEETIKEPQKTNILIAETIETTPKFSKQVQIAQDVYQIRNDDNKLTEEKTENKHQVDAPALGDNLHQQINIQNAVLQKPSNLSKSTPKTSTASNMNPANVHPLSLPTMTPSNKNASKTERADLNEGDARNVLPLPNVIIHKKLPAGVVPVPPDNLQKNEEPLNEKTDDKNNIPDEINLALPNRYRNNIIESQMANELMKETKGENKANLQNEPELNMGLDINQQDNAAMEVIDQPKNPAQEDPLHLLDANAPLIDTNQLKLQHAENGLKDSVVQLIESKRKRHNDGLHGAENAHGENGALRGAAGGGAYEAEADYDGQKDLQIDEAEPEGEEDDDGDDYEDHLAARQKDPAVRN